MCTHDEFITPLSNPLSGVVNGRTHQFYVACCKNCNATLIDEECGEFDVFRWEVCEDDHYLDVMMHLDSFCGSDDSPLYLFNDLIDECERVGICPVIRESGELLTDVIYRILK